jgi:hypothetical protein
MMERLKPSKYQGNENITLNPIWAQLSLLSSVTVAYPAINKK